MVYHHPLWHHIGVFLLLVAWVLLLVSSISAPVFNDIAFAKVTLTNATNFRRSSVSFGAFGYCVLDVPPITSDQDWCSPRVVGYTPVNTMANIDGPGFQVSHPDALNNLTKGFVLHPIAAFLAFLAFVIAIIPFWVASLLGSITASLAFIISLVAMAFDIAVFRAIRDAVNNDGSGSDMHFATAIWLVIVATICLFLGSLIVFFSCCSTRGSFKTRNRQGF